MRRSASKLFLLILTALWLPVQGVALLVMPLSMLTPSVALAASTNATGAMASHADRAEMPCHAGDDQTDDETASACQRCSVCQHGCSGYTANSTAAGQWLAAHPVLQPGVVSKLTSQVPEPLDHPPRHAH